MFNNDSSVTGDIDIVPPENRSELVGSSQKVKGQWQLVKQEQYWAIKVEWYPQGEGTMRLYDFIDILDAKTGIELYRAYSDPDLDIGIKYNKDS